MFRFEKFDVWHKAVDFASKIHSATAIFPADERFGLTSQMRRASVSISSNIAEGSSRSSPGEFARFLEIAYGSLMETVSQAVISRKQAFLPNDRFQELYQDAEEIGRMLSGLRGTLVQ
jgi:four helix bundle protein